LIRNRLSTSLAEVPCHGTLLRDFIRQKPANPVQLLRVRLPVALLREGVGKDVQLLYPCDEVREVLLVRDRVGRLIRDQAQGRGGFAPVADIGVDVRERRRSSQGGDGRRWRGLTIVDVRN